MRVEYVTLERMLASRQRRREKKKDAAKQMPMMREIMLSNPMIKKASKAKANKCYAKPLSHLSNTEL